jgi:hypothetical protein
MPDLINPSKSSKEVMRLTLFSAIARSVHMLTWASHSGLWSEGSDLPKAGMLARAGAKTPFSSTKGTSADTSVTK